MPDLKSLNQMIRDEFFAKTGSQWNPLSWGIVNEKEMVEWFIKLIQPALSCTRLAFQEMA